jgi:hypothetical protein
MSQEQVRLKELIGVTALCLFMGQWKFLWPALFTWSLMTTFLKSRPAPYLFVWGLLGELLGTALPGAALVTSLWPMIIKRLARRIKIDLTFSYLGVVMAATASQIMIYMLAQDTRWRHELLAPETWVSFFPWQQLLFMAAATSLAVYVVTIFLGLRRPVTG